MSEENWKASGTVEGVASSLRRLLRRGLHPSALVRAQRELYAPVATALRIPEAGAAETALAISTRLGEVVEGFAPQSRTALRVLLGLDETDETLTKRRHKASELFGLTAESFRKTREPELLKQVAGNLLLAAANRQADQEVDERDTSARGLDEFTQRFRSAVELETRAIDVDMPETRRSLDRYFVDPWLEVTVPHEPGTRIAGSALADQFRRAVILGDPGSGKTTLIRNLARRMAFVGRDVPFLVGARDIAEPGLTLVEHLEATIRGHFQLVPPRHYVDRVIAGGRAAVLIDGLDELPSLPARRRLVRSIEQLVSRYPHLRLFVTSRRVGYSEASLNEEFFARVELLALDRAQQAEFVSRWFDGTTLSNAGPGSVAELIEQCTRLAPPGNPLLMTLLSKVVAKTGTVPADSSELLRQYVRLVVLDLDRARGIEGPKYLPASIVENITAAVARHVARAQKPYLSEREMVRLVSGAIVEGGAEVGAARSQTVEYLRFCRERSWVVTEVGKNPDGEPLYGFTHLAFQELYASSSYDAMQEETGDQRRRTDIHARLADLEAQQGYFSAARDLYNHALAIEEQTGDTRGEANSLAQITRLETRQGNLAEAGHLYHHALAMVDETSGTEARPPEDPREAQSSASATAPPASVSGRFSLDGWWVHLPTDEPQAAQYASAHESHHLQLQNSSSFGSVQRTLVELHALTGDERYRTAVAALTDLCRVVQEGFATWAPALVIGWDVEELSERFPAYARHYRSFDRLLRAIGAPYLRLHAGHALARACMQPPIIGIALEQGLDAFRPAHLRQRDQPDARFAVLRRIGIDWSEPVNAITHALEGRRDQQLLLGADSLTAEHFAPRHADVWEIANRAMYDAVFRRLAARGIPTIAYDGHLAETPGLLEAAGRLAGRPLRLEPGDARRPERSALASLRTAEAEGFTTGGPLRCRVLPHATPLGALVADVNDPHAFLAIRPRSELAQNYEASSVAIAEGGDVAVVLRRTVMDPDGSPTVELLEVASPLQDLQRALPLITSVSLSCVRYDVVSTLGADLSPSTSTVLVDVSLAAHLDLWLGYEGAEFRYAFLRTESFRRVVPFLLGRYGQPGEGWSHLLIRPLSHAGVRVHKAAFDELRAEGMRLIEDPALLEEQQRLLHLTLAHIAGEEVRFGLTERGSRFRDSPVVTSTHVLGT